MSQVMTFATLPGAARIPARKTIFTALVAVILTGHLAMGIHPASAEPRMVILEYPLEATGVISMHVNRAGRGTIALWCAYCENRRIRLSVNPKSRLTVNGKRRPLHRFTQKSGDIVSAFYREPDGVLTRLIVSR